MEGQSDGAAQKSAQDEWPDSKAFIVRLCEPCIVGEGDVCHTPDCVMCRHDVSIPFMRELLTEVPDVLKAEAAPDLFAALEALEADIRDAGGLTAHTEALMRAAIAKARGLVADACEGCQRTDVGTRLSADDVRLCEACFAECAAATKTRGEVQP